MHCLALLFPAFYLVRNLCSVRLPDLYRIPDPRPTVLLQHLPPHWNPFPLRHLRSLAKSPLLSQRSPLAKAFLLLQQSLLAKASPLPHSPRQKFLFLWYLLWKIPLLRRSLLQTLLPLLQMSRLASYLLQKLSRLRLFLPPPQNLLRFPNLLPYQRNLFPFLLPRYFVPLRYSAAALPLPGSPGSEAKALPPETLPAPV